jgi:antitoxin ParD1/3/4
MPLTGGFPMPTRNVVITDHQAAFLDSLVAEGRYQNVSEAMREGLRALERSEVEFHRIRAGVLEGLAQAERGEFVEGTMDEVFDRALAKALVNTTSE